MIWAGGVQPATAPDLSALMWWHGVLLGRAGEAAEARPTG